MSEIKYPQIECKLIGTDGNAFAIIGNVSRALRNGGVSTEDVSAFTAEAFRCHSYDELLALVMRTVDVS